MTSGAVYQCRCGCPSCIKSGPHARHVCPTRVRTTPEEWSMLVATANAVEPDVTGDVSDQALELTQFSQPEVVVSDSEIVFASPEISSWVTGDPVDDIVWTKTNEPVVRLMQTTTDIRGNRPMSLSTSYAQCGVGTLPGMVRRADDELKHLGPLAELGVDMKSSLFLTRCGLTSVDGPWEIPDDDDVDMWCLDCIRQGDTPAVPFLIVTAGGDS